YTYSNIAYQCAKIHDKMEQSKLRNWILDLEFRHFGIPVPDLNIFLDVPFSFTERKLSGSRLGDDRTYLNGSADIHEADIEFQRNVRNVYLETAVRDERLTVIKCSDENEEMKTPAEIFEMVRELLYSHNILN
ncbi:MAG: thymidylate kinase, partial [Bacteroidales bacterium]|nr:thymidylate kinase [Bacteroidales bacterium]